MRLFYLALFAFPTVGLADPEADWDGLYLGGGLQFSRGETEVIGNRFTYNQRTALNFVRHDYDGFGVHGFVGKNVRRGDFVFGFEMSLAFASLESSLVFNTDNDIDQVEINWSGSLTGRAGRAFGDNLFYVKGGLAVADIRNVGGDVNNGSLQLSDAHIREDILLGPTVGVGFERLLNDKYSLRVEYNYTEFRDFSQANQDGAPGSQVYNVDNGPLQSLNIGIVLDF
ncbi:outer membrane beta-barrel protein [Rhodobacteraceae bacterium]|nr:outer membrane beta-barrel protein [Paracoccaceae bacterium]